MPCTCELDVKCNPAPLGQGRPGAPAAHSRHPLGKGVRAPPPLLRVATATVNSLPVTPGAGWPVRLMPPVARGDRNSMQPPGRPWGGVAGTLDAPCCAWRPQQYAASRRSTSAGARPNRPFFSSPTPFQTDSVYLSKGFFLSQRSHKGLPKAPFFRRMPDGASRGCPKSRTSVRRSRGTPSPKGPTAAHGPGRPSRGTPPPLARKASPTRCPP